MSRLNTFISNKDLEAKSIAGYCARHRCPAERICERCIGWFHYKEKLKELLNVLVQIKH